MQPASGRVERDRRFWKILAIVQFIGILLIGFHTKFTERVVKTLIITEEETMSTSSSLKSIQEIDESSMKKKLLPFDSQFLEMIQSQTHIELVTEIQKYWLKPPSEKPYNITLDTTSDLSAVKRLHKGVLKLFKEKKNGFFIECGAFDGVALSNTLHLEQEHNWTGLLVEADPNYYERLLQKHRKAWTINACLSMKPKKGKVRMTRIKDEDALTVISEIADSSYKGLPQAEEFDVQCFPVTSILGAMGQTMNVDYFSLDIEGAELGVLQTIPWDFVYIKVISLEANAARIGGVKKFLGSKNYKKVGTVSGPWIHDHIFVHKQFAEDLDL